MTLMSTRMYAGLAELRDNRWLPKEMQDHDEGVR